MKTKNKIVLLGDSGVGKTSLVRRWLTNSFNENQTPTIGTAFIKTTFTFRGQENDVQVWDTAGEEKYRSMAPIYVQGAFAAVLVYDRTCKSTLDNIKIWLQQIKSIDKQIPYILCGNKSDMVDECEVDLEEGIAFAESINTHHFATSAVSGINVSEVFEEILTIAFKKKIENEKRNKTTASLDLKKTQEKKSCC